MVTVAQIVHTEIASKRQIAQEADVRMFTGFGERVDDVLHFGMIRCDAESVLTECKIFID